MLDSHPHPDIMCIIGESSGRGSVPLKLCAVESLRAPGTGSPHPKFQARRGGNGRAGRFQPGAGHDGGRIVFEGTPADLVAARSTLTGEHLAAYVGA